MTTTDPELLAAQARRNGEPDQEPQKVTLSEESIDKAADQIIELSAKTVGPDARFKLRNLLKFYASKPKPFTACVHDNMKRFGPGRTEAVCATLKDIIRGTTNWRKGGGHHAALSSDVESFEVDDEVAEILLSIPDDKLSEIEAEVVVNG